MGKTAKISPIKKNYPSHPGQETIRTSLSKNGYNFYPGTRRPFIPYMEKNGEYRTGLNVNAQYIRDILDEDEREAEIKYIESVLASIKATGGDNVDLSPNAPYYTSKFTALRNDGRQYFSIINLMDESLEFDLTRPFDDEQNNKYGIISYAWMRVHPDIAPSLKHYEEHIVTTRCPEISTTRYFVDDENYQAEEAYKYTQMLSDAITKWGIMTPSRQLKTAVLLGLGVNSMDKAGVIFNAGFNFISEKNPRNKEKNIKRFFEVASQDEKYQDVAYLVEDALSPELGIYMSKAGRIWHNEIEMGKTKAEVIAKLMTDDFQQDRIMLQTAVDSKKSVILTN